MYIITACIAYITDKIFGEFQSITHPVIYMGRYISWYEKRFYKDSIFSGVILNLSLISIVATISFFIEYALGNSPISQIILGIISSTTIASNMLYSAVKDTIDNPDSIKYLVSRDTDELSISDKYKASIETYSENLSDGVIAPLLYLILFGMLGAFIYKAINTLDSMVAYRNDKYEKFGKFSAKVDDIANFIPSRLTAILILLLFNKLDKIPLMLKQGSLHDSPNAGYPISAMGLSINILLGGDTSYFGKIKKKPKFGEGSENITKNDVINALSIQNRLDTTIILTLSLWVMIIMI